MPEQIHRIASAEENESVVLTNDSDFLDDTRRDVTVLYFPDDEVTADDLTSRIVELQDSYPTQSSLPALYFLSADLGR